MRQSSVKNLLFLSFGIAGFVFPGAADVVTDWNTVIINTTRADRTLPGPTYPSRACAMVHLAIYDVVNTIHRTHEPYLVDTNAEEDTSLEAGVSQTAHDILVAIYPVQSATLDAALATHLTAIPIGPAKDNGIALGQEVAEAYLRVRSVDNAFDTFGEADQYPNGTLPGEWRRTPPDFSDPFGQEWGNVGTFGILSGSQFRAPAPPALTSPEYAASLNQVKAIGELNSASRTPDQTQIAIFWAYDRPGLGPRPVLYNQIIQTIAADQGNTVEENARLFALVNMAQADGVIACWETKYFYDLWRPITAIREADSDGNDATIADASWTPLGSPGGGVMPDFTPPFPAYGSGHATFGGATFGMLKKFYGRDDISFTLASDELNGATRSYTSFSHAAEENGLSRIYMGVHYDFDVIYATIMGREVAEFIYRNYLRPIPDADLDGDGDCDAQDLLLLQQVWHEKQ